MTVTSVDTGPRTITRSAEVAVPAADLFAVLADPRRHGELDGSGTVLDLAQGPERLGPGSTFTVKMKQHGFPYKIKSRVTEFVDGSLIEWQHPLGHRWRWELTPLTGTTTQVTETFDYSSLNAVKRGSITAFGMIKANEAGIEKTLEQLQAKHA